MEVVQVTAKRVEDALKDALRQLNATIDDVDVKVIDAGGGLFGSAKLEVSLTEEVKAERERRAARDNRRREERNGRERREQPVFEQPRDVKKDNSAPFKKPEQNKPQEQNRPQENNHPEAKNDKGKNFANKQQQQPAQQQTKPQQKPQGQPKNQPPQKPQQPKQEQPPKAKEPQQASRPDAPSEIPEKSLNETMAFLKNVIAKMGIETELKTNAHGWDLDVTVLSDDPALIGYHGETLDSIEYLAGLVANRDTEKYVRVSLDSNNYRDKRSDSLVKLAEKMAAKCIKTEHKVSLEPMNSANRKVVHAALSSNDKVTTRSEGKEPNRRVVIYFKRGAKQGEGKQGECKPDKRDFKQKNGDKPEIKKEVDEPKEEAVEKLIPPSITPETENAVSTAPVEETTVAAETVQDKPETAPETAQAVTEKPKTEEPKESPEPEQKQEEGEAEPKSEEPEAE